MSLAKYIAKLALESPAEAKRAKDLLQQLRHSTKTVDNMKEGHELWTYLRKDPNARAALWRPGGAFDPVALQADKAAMDAHRMAELEKNIMARYTPDEFSQARGKKSAEKAKGFVSGIDEIFEGPKIPAQHMTRDEITAAAKKDFSRRDYMEALSSDPVLTSKMSDSKRSDIAELLDPVGSGKSGYRHFKSEKKRAGKELMTLLEKIRPKKPWLDE